jgi:hypothetical protein
LNKKLIQVGVIRTAAKLSLSERLCEIEADIEELLKKYKPDHHGSSGASASFSCIIKTFAMRSVRLLYCLG